MNEMPNELKDLLIIIGALVVIAFFLAVLVIAVMKILDLIMEYRDTKRYEYKIAHRFDNPPLAKCYCIDCKYCYGEPTKSGSGVYCSLFGGRLIIQDNSFCYRAQPKCEENVRNV